MGQALQGHMPSCLRPLQVFKHRAGVYGVAGSSPGGGPSCADAQSSRESGDSGPQGPEVPAPMCQGPLGSLPAAGFPDCQSQLCDVGLVQFSAACCYLLTLQQARASHPHSCHLSLCVPPAGYHLGTAPHARVIWAPVAMLLGPCCQLARDGPRVQLLPPWTGPGTTVSGQHLGDHCGGGDPGQLWG